MAASLSDLFLFPLTRTSTVTKEEYLLDYGYICSKQPCDNGCTFLISDQDYKPQTWSKLCDKCGNYVEFVDLAKYIKCIGQYGRRIVDMKTFIQVNFAYKGKEGTNNCEFNGPTFNRTGTE